MIRIGFILLFIVGLIWPVLAASYKVNVGEDYAFKLGKEKTSRLIAAIYAPLGIVPNVHFLPTERGLAYVNAGQFDAEGGRITAIGSSYENLVAIPEPLYQTQFAYFCLRREQCMHRQGAVYAVPKGDLITALFCEQKGFNCFFVNNDISAFKALEVGTADILIATLNIASGVICASEVRQAFYLPEPDIDGTVYHFVNAKHRDKVPALQASIKALKQKGVFDNFSASLRDLPLQCGAEFQILSMEDTYAN